MMSSTEPTLIDLAGRGDLKTLESRWLEVVEAGPDARQESEMLETLDALNRGGLADRAADLGEVWLTMQKERGITPALLALTSKLAPYCGDNEAFRQDIVELYTEVYADRPELETLLEASGVSGGKTLRRALRTLEICLNLKVGDYLVARSDEHAAQVTGIDPDTCMYTLRARGLSETLDADALALAYDPVDAQDFRVLKQLHPDRIVTMLEEAPVELVLELLKTRQGRLDADELEHLLCPQFIAPDKWSKWWTRTRTGLKRCPNVVLEGRNPVMLTYHADGQTLEDEILPQWAKAETTAQRLNVVETYFREVKSRGGQSDPRLLEQLHRDLTRRVETTRRGAPANALGEALVIDRIAEEGLLPDTACPARAIMQESTDPIALLRGVEDNALYLRALGHLREVAGDRWPDVYAQLLPIAPLAACETIAQTLSEGGHEERLAAAVRRIPTNFDRHLDAVCWLWRGSGLTSKLPGDVCPSPRELLPRLLEYLAALTRDDHTEPAILRHARTIIRAAMGAANYRRYREVIESMEPGVALTVRRTLERIDGLGQVVRSTMIAIIRETHPQLEVRRQVDPWQDDSRILTTDDGLRRREEELKHLVNVKMQENARAIGEAAARGDLSENSEYKFALEERDLLRARVAKMQDEVSLAQVLTADDVSTAEVGFGTRVLLRGRESGNVVAFTILGPFEADMDRNIYNYRAPLCHRIRGLKVGDAVTLELESGQDEYAIEAIDNAISGRQHA